MLLGQSLKIVSIGLYNRAQVVIASKNWAVKAEYVIVNIYGQNQNDETKTDFFCEILELVEGDEIKI